MRTKLSSYFIVAVHSIVISLLITSCISYNLDPIPQREEIVCHIIKFQDMTGTYDSVNPSLEELIQIKLTDDYTFKYEIFSSGDKTVFLANQFTSNNNLIMNKKDLIISGQVEQIKYGYPQDIKTNLANYHFFGLLGLEIFSDDNDLRMAMIEYRIKILDSQKKILKTMIIQGTYKADVNKLSREEIITIANKSVAEEFVWRINNELSEIFEIEPQKFIFNGKYQDEFPSKLWNFKGKD